MGLVWNAHAVTGPGASRHSWTFRGTEIEKYKGEVARMRTSRQVWPIGVGLECTCGDRAWSFKAFLETYVR